MDGPVNQQGAPPAGQQGWPVQGGPPPGPSPYRQAPAPPVGPFCPPEDVEPGKTWAVIGYLLSPLWIVPLMERNNAFALFHAKQALVYMIFATVVSMIAMALAMVTCGIGAIAVFPLLYPWIMGIVYAAQGEYRELPWFGQYAEQWFSSIVANKRPGGHPAFAGPYPPSTSLRLDAPPSLPVEDSLSRSSDGSV